MTTSARSARPALALFLLAPIIGEFLLGNVPLDGSALVLLVPLMLLYGGGALLIREVARRAGRGLPTMAVLALAYAVVEEGLVTQSLFNPDYLGLNLHAYGALPAVGMGGPWTLFVLVIHVVWSILVPIVVVELICDRPTTPWLGPGGTVGAGVLLVLGAAAIGAGTAFTEQFLAGPAQLAGAAVAAVLLAVLAFRLPASTGSARSAAPRPVVCGIVTFAMASALFVVQEFGLTRQLLPAALATALTAAVVVAGVVLPVRWSRGQGWSARHRAAVVVGAILTYCWVGVRTQLDLRGVDFLVGQAVLAAAAIVLVVAVLRRAARRDPVTR